MAASRKFTLAEANALLPWLERTFAEIARQREAAGPLQHELEQITRRTRSNGHGDLDEPLRQAEQRVAQHRDRMRELFSSIVEKDIEIRDVDIGLVDFPGERGGRDVWLCWRTGEPAVAHWHEIDQGFRDRKPL